MKTRRKGRLSFKRRKGWKGPTQRQRTNMLSTCGRRCFLGPNKSYPICEPLTCRRTRRGVWAAFMRAKQQHKRKIAAKADVLLRKKSLS